MNEDQQIRAAALAAAAQSGVQGIRELTQAAELLAEWIRTGTLPEPTPGTYY